MKKANYTTF